MQVSCTYPGASSKVVADTVAAPIEQQVIGVENMLYMSSQCTNDGGYNLTVTFEVGTNLDMAQVLVQNRVNLALPTLPQRSEADRRQRQEEVAEHPAGRQPDLAQGHVRPALSEQLRHDSTSRRAGPDQRRRRRDLSWASSTTACGPGSIPSGWPPATCRPATWSPPCASRTCRSPPARSAARPCRTGQAFQYTLSTLGRLTDPERVRQHRRENGRRRASSRACATSSPTFARTRRARPSAAFNSAPRSKTPPAASTASRRSAWASSSSRARTRSTPPRRFARGWTS